MLAGAEVSRVDGDPDLEIGSLVYDSRRAEPGSLFFCVPGHVTDGHDFARYAVDAGASALVLERDVEVAPGVTKVYVADARSAMAQAASRFYDEPTESLRVAGITGTNGKTTTAFLVRHVLESLGLRTGLLGTVKQVVGGVEEPVERTTPEAIDLQRTFRRMVDAGDRFCAIEVSSHALALRRTLGIRFAVATFTNLTQDHLDFHVDMEDYFQAKRRLFVAERSERHAINADDEYGRRLLAESDDAISFSASGAPGATLRALDVSFDALGSRFVCTDGDQQVEVTSGLPGLFNVENLLAALATLRCLGFGLVEVAEALSTAPRVPGRFEPIDEGQGFGVLVDYAHTPDSLDNVLRSARPLTTGRLISVFGCGGDRDRAKRPLMGEIGARLSDLAIVTSDNPRSEDPERIVDEVLEGARAAQGGGELRAVVDREQAIADALAVAEPGDTVVIAGKGHEQGQEFAGGRKIPFDDRDVAREALRRLADGQVARR
ncbi:UDP-N-acetylmuramoyl-L-alanyl-D-glutamate--2,6-diaminopimelate ligase [Thermoleophilia bacterium SCSIO 60948]|nr:UDP-N-acetylmuramoyl-L-alanyl-D-glutamate--2,6-diaminopimelate ligase [Thermoleophilia bacterium SCSIO 60948]